MTQDLLVVPSIIKPFILNIYHDLLISQVLLNGTTEVSVTFRGILNLRSEYLRKKFHNSRNNFQGYCSIISYFYYDYNTTFDVDRNYVHLKTGTVCPFIDEYCFDDVEEEAAYKNIPKNICSSYGVDVFYEDNVTLLTITQNPINHYIIVNTQCRVFTLKLLKKQNLCFEMVRQTEVDGLK